MLYEAPGGNQVDGVPPVPTGCRINRRSRVTADKHDKLNLKLKFDWNDKFNVKFISIAMCSIKRCFGIHDRGEKWIVKA